MKLLLLSLAALLFTGVEPLSYSGVKEVPSATKEQLFTRARSWFNNSFKSSKDVIQVADKESGELSGKGIVKLKATYKYLGKQQVQPVHAEFTVSVWVKDGKYKYEIKDFDTDNVLNNNYDFGLLTTADKTTVKWPMMPQRTMQEMWVSVKRDAATEAELLAASLDKAMKSDTGNW